LEELLVSSTGSKKPSMIEKIVITIQSNVFVVKRLVLAEQVLKYEYDLLLLLQRVLRNQNVLNCLH
jgi:hypothetical protein